MAPIGLAHRPTFEFIAEWTDVEVELPEEDPYPQLVDRRRREAAAAASDRRKSIEESRFAEPSPDGWLAGEPLF